MSTSVPEAAKSPPPSEKPKVPAEGEKKPSPSVKPASVERKAKLDEPASSDDDSSASDRRAKAKNVSDKKAPDGRRKDKAKISSSGGASSLLAKKSEEKGKDGEGTEDKRSEKGHSLRLKIAEKNEDEELETMRLNIAQTKKTEIKVPLPVYEAYNKIAEFASRLNTSWEEAEVVFIGPRGSGKTALIESLLGHPVSVVRDDAGHEGTSRRPLFIHMINNPSCEAPRVTLKREKAKVTGNFSQDKVVKIEELPTEVEKRNAISSSDPISVLYEWRYTWNLTFIDTPGLVMETVVGSPDTSTSSYSKNSETESVMDRQRLKIEMVVEEVITPPHRLIVAVEQAQHWETVQMIDWVQRIDPRRTRTIFAYSKFYSNVLRNIAVSKELNSYLSGSPVNNAFFVSVFSATLRKKLIPDQEEYSQKLKLAYQRDMNMMEQLKYDKKFTSCLEVHSLRRYITEKTWKMYYDNIPKLLKCLNQEKSETGLKIERVMRELEDLRIQNLRSVASTYLMEFLHAVSRLIVGTSEGLPSLHGETAEQERHAQGDWIDAKKNVIKVRRKWPLPYLDIKLYGGQQFERLLSEFKMVVQNTGAIEATFDELANAGRRSGPSFDHLAWAASDLTQRHSQQELYPLIKQLCKRSVHIFRRLGGLAANIVESKRKASRAGHKSSIDEIEYIDVAAGGVLDKVESFPYFKKKVLELYDEFVASRSDVCKERCMDEFHCTRLIYWELTNFSALPEAYTSRGHESISKLADSLWDDMRTRIAHNIALKCHHFFLVPMESELPSELQAHFTCLSDAQIEEIFEVHPIRERLNQELVELKERLAKCEESIKTFSAAASDFSNSFSL